jgi:hypothetical protein
MKEVDDSTFYSIFDGLMLSDGHVRCPKRAIRSRYSHTCKYKEYILYIMMCLKEAGFGYSPNAPYQFTHSWAKKETITYMFESNMDDFFKQQRSRWYPKGEKIVPVDLKLTPEVLLHWYIGDGELNHSKRIHTTGIRLNTHSFSVENLRFLIGKLECLGFTASIHKRNRLYIGSEYFRDFLFYIGTSPVSCYGYKWIVDNRELYDSVKSLSTKDNQQPSS